MHSIDGAPVFEDGARVRYRPIYPRYDLTEMDPGDTATVDFMRVPEPDGRVFAKVTPHVDRQAKEKVLVCGGKIMGRVGVSYRGGEYVDTRNLLPA